MSELTREALIALIDDDEHGLLVPEVKPEPVTNADILANRFEEINAFIDQHNRNPDAANRGDIGEFQLGHRLQAVLDNLEYRKALEHLDRHRLFAEDAQSRLGSIDDLLGSGDPLIDSLLDPTDGESVDLFERKHLPPPSREAPEKVAKGKPCEDFERFERLFVACHADLRAGRRQLKPFRNPSNIKEGFFYVQRGILVYIDVIGELTQKSPGLDGRLRLIYENGTESDLLLQSLARNLYDRGRIVTERNDIYVESFATPDHMATGHVYVARTHSIDPNLTQFDHLHKIGYTAGSVESRIAGAENEATFLHAPASLTLTFEMPAEYAKFIETAMHQFFSEVRLDAWFEEGPAPREWFNVPLSAIEEAVDLIQSGQLANYCYNPATRAVELA